MKRILIAIWMTLPVLCVAQGKADSSLVKLSSGLVEIYKEGDRLYMGIPKGQARRLLRDIRVAQASQTDEPTKLHLEDCADRLNRILNPNK